MHKAFLFSFLFLNAFASSNLLASTIANNDIRGISYMEEPNFNLFVRDQKVSVKGDYSFLEKDSQYIIENVVASSENKLSQILITSLKAKFDKILKILEFEGSIILNFEKGDTIFSINTEFLKYNLSDAKLTTDQELQGRFNNLKVESSGMTLDTESKGFYAEFDKGTIEINNSDSIYKGYAKKIIISSVESILVLDGKALLDQEGLIIKSDLIHYDYLKKKIIKSVNSEIENRT
jgi:hypothetical protein